MYRYHRFNEPTELPCQVEMGELSDEIESLIQDHIEGSIESMFDVIKLDIRSADNCYPEDHHEKGKYEEEGCVFVMSVAQGWGEEDKSTPIAGVNPETMAAMLWQESFDMIDTGSSAEEYYLSLEMKALFFEDVVRRIRDNFSNGDPECPEHLRNTSGTQSGTVYCATRQNTHD